MSRVVFPEFREQYKTTKYPFIDTATLVSGDLKFPKEIFCDASIYIPGATPPVYISNLTITGTESTLTVSDYSKKYTATGIINPTAKTIELYSPNNKQVGILVATTDLTYFTNIPTGEYNFTYRATSFVPRCIIQLKDTGVTTIGVKDGEALEGNVWLCGKDGIILRYVDDAIRFDIVGEPLFKQEEPNFRFPSFVQTINGFESDEYGNFNITVLDQEDILRINSDSEGITISAAGV